jgi:hypothetical protein
MRLVLIPTMLAAALAACGQAESPAANRTADAAPLSAGRNAATEREAQADPVAFVRAIYSDYENGDDIPDVADRYSRGLRGLIERDRREAAGEIGRLDFDPWINGQDWEISDVAVSESPREGARRIVVARFNNSGIATTIRFELVEENGRWLIDDIVRQAGPGEGWRLREILSAPL